MTATATPDIDSLPFVREKPKQKVSDLFALVDRPTRRAVVDTDAIRVHTEGDDRTISFKPTDAKDPIEVPLTQDGIDQISRWVKVTPKNVERWDDHLTGYVLGYLLRNTKGEAAVTYVPDEGITAIRTTKQYDFDLRSIVEVAARVVGEASPVHDFHDGEAFLFSTTVSERSTRHTGGDIKEGDISYGGLRFGQNRKANHAPWVQPFIYRLVCTNGMEVPDASSKVDARGLDVAEVMEDLEVQARRLFSEVDHRIEEFYALRDVPVDNPERHLIRIEQETGSLGKRLQPLMERAALIEGDPSMFDLVNLITHEANDPSLNLDPMLRLQSLGGHLVVQHAARCPQCKAALNN